MEIHIRIAQKTYGKQKESKAALEAATKAQNNKAMEEARVMLKSMTDELKKQEDLANKFRKEKAEIALKLQ